MKKRTYAVATLTVFLDQLTKYLAVTFLPFENQQVLIPNFFSLTYTKNTGGAFSFLSNNVELLSVIGLIVLIACIYYLKKNPPQDTLESFSLGIILGGLIGNLLDRLLRGGVIDFLDFYILNYDYPVFNIADIGIVIGIIGLLIIETRGDIIERRSRKHSTRSISK